MYLITNVKIVGMPMVGELQIGGDVFGTDGSVTTLDFTTNFPGLTNAIKTSNFRNNIRAAAVAALAALSPPVVVDGGDDVILIGDVVALDL